MALIVGNLDCESDFAALALKRGRRSLPQRVLRTISEAAALLRVIAEPGDRLWTPLPVDPDRIPPLSDEESIDAHAGGPAQAPGAKVPGVGAGLDFCSGPLRPERGEEVLAWGRTARIAELGKADAQPAPTDSARPTDLVAPTRSLREQLLSVPPVAPEVVARVNHRALALRTARNLGCALPGAARIASLDDLRLHLQLGGAKAGAGNAWVVKAPWSAAGRLRFIAAASRDPAAVLEVPEICARLARLLTAQGELLFEPWMDRVDDWGCALWVGPESVEILGLHRLLVDRRGRFEGIAAAGDSESTPGRILAVGRRSGREVVDKSPAALAAGDQSPVGQDPASPDSVGLRPSERDTLLEVAREAAEVLRQQGYRGPAGVDAWRYRTDAGIRLHSLGEINARLTFGWVWRAWNERQGLGR